MKSLAYFDIAGQQVATHAVQILKLECRGDDSMAAGTFWQVHDSASVPTNGAVPVKSWPAYTGAPDYKDFTGAELNLVNGCYVCISTTEATKTLGTGSNKFADLQVELTEAERPSGTSSAGDLTTGVAARAVWTDASGPKQLIRVQTVSVSMSGTRYLMLFAEDAPANGDKPIAQFKITSGAALDLKFGADGRDVKSIAPNTSTIRDGCRLELSDTTDTLTKASGGSGDTIAIKAEYK